MITIRHKTRTATIKEVSNRLESRFYYSVWDQRSGFIASGFRRTLEDATKVANVVLKRS
jgi:hypothetical protein